MLIARPFTSRILTLSLLLAACGETAPNDSKSGSGGAPQGGTAGVSGAAPLGGTGGAGTSGAAGSGQAGSGPLGGTGGSQAGTGGSAGVVTGAGAGAGGGAGDAGSGGAAGAGAGQSGAGGASGAAGGGTGGAGGAMGGAAGGGGKAGAGGGGGKAGAGGSGGKGGAGGSGGTTAYNPCPAAPAPCVILPFGDSITDGYGTPGGYRIDLFRLALNANQRITFVGSLVNGPTMVNMVTFPRNHEGHSGWTIDNDASHSGISPLVPAAIARNPDIVLLMIGTNDLNQNVDVANAPTRLGNLLNSILNQSSHVLVVVARIVPGRQDTLNTKVMTYNNAIPGLVSMRAGAGKHIVSVDMYAAFTRDANYKTALLADDLHPNPAGYARMADTWYAAVGSLFR